MVLRTVIHGDHTHASQSEFTACRRSTKPLSGRRAGPDAQHFDSVIDDSADERKRRSRARKLPYTLHLLD